MKKMLLMPLAALCVMLTGCSDSNSGSHQSVKDFKGTYSLSQSSGSIAGDTYNFDYGVVTWTFDPSTRKVTVVNNNDNPEAYDGPDSGTYDYSVVNSDNPQLCEKVLLVNNVDYGCFEVDDIKMNLSNNFADGYVFNFSRLIME